MNVADMTTYDRFVRKAGVHFVDRVPAATTSREWALQDACGVAPTGRPPRAPAKPRAREHPARELCSLSAPDMSNDFYDNPIDWSNGPRAAVALGPDVFTWHVHTRAIAHVLHESPDQDDGERPRVRAVAWAPSQRQLAACVQGSLRVCDGSEDRFASSVGLGGEGAVCRWRSEHEVLVGDRKGRLRVVDVRSGRQEAVVPAHRSTVCGLKVSADRDTFASGGNDNAVHVWSARMLSRPTLTVSSHRSAVKALAFDTTGRALASGGGTHDRTVRVTSLASGRTLAERDLGAQVCDMHWSKTSGELAVCCGYDGWRVQVLDSASLATRQRLSGHSDRPLCMAGSPDNRFVMTGSCREVVVWDMFRPVEPRLHRLSLRFDVR